MSLSVGEEIERERLLSDLVTRGYERVDQVERCGHFSVRGDIVDIFAISEKHPVRAEFLAMKLTVSACLMRRPSVLSRIWKLFHVYLSAWKGLPMHHFCHI
ncbi:MAG: hypothetical protein ACLR1D_02475 [Dialister sp.]